MTTSLKTWNDYADKYGEPLTVSDKAYFRAQTKRHVHGVVLEKFSEYATDDRRARARLAERLGVDRSQITRWLSSPGNWTLDTLSDLLLAMGCKATLVANEIGDVQQGNYVHPDSISLQPQEYSTETMVWVDYNQSNDTN